MAKTSDDTTPVQLLTGRAARDIVCGFPALDGKPHDTHSQDPAYLQWLSTESLCTLPVQDCRVYGSMTAPGVTPKRYKPDIAHRQCRAMLHAVIMKTPVGYMLALADQDRPLLLTWLDSPRLARQIRKIRRIYPNHAVIWAVSPLLEAFQRLLCQYFTCPQTAQPDDSILAQIHRVIPTLGTVFQATIWAQLMSVPPGHTTTYQQLADDTGIRLAVRATASAIGENHFMILIPCHRVIRSDGGPGGYAGGIDVKRQLLDWEKA